jgi:hypothetical protein
MVTKVTPKLLSSWLGSKGRTERYVMGFVLIGMGLLVSLSLMKWQIVEAESLD